MAETSVAHPPAAQPPMAQPLPPLAVKVYLSNGRLASTPKSTGSRLVGGFTPSQIVAQQGQTVTLEIVSREGTHALGIPEYGLHSNTLGPGETAKLTFVADKAGVFNIVCEKECGEFHPRMTAKLVVTARSGD